MTSKASLKELPPHTEVTDDAPPVDTSGDTAPAAPLVKPNLAVLCNRKSLLPGRWRNWKHAE